MVPAIDWTLPVGPLVGRTAAWAEEVRAPRPAPPAISAETSSAIPRAGRSRRFEDGYDILLSSRERGDGGGKIGGLQGYRGVAPLWPAFGTRRSDRGRPAAHLVWEGVREAPHGFLLSRHFLDGSRGPGPCSQPDGARPNLPFHAQSARRGRYQRGRPGRGPRPPRGRGPVRRPPGAGRAQMARSGPRR